MVTICGSVLGQQTELSLRLNSGLFSFSGKSAETFTNINYNLDDEDGYTNNPYGSKVGLSYGISTNLSRITKSNFKFGIGLGYEILRSKIDVNSISVRSTSSLNTEVIEAEGKTFLIYDFINLFPYIGYRISTLQFNIDIEGGLDFGHCLKATERGRAKSSSREYETIRDRKTIEKDIRTRFQVGISKNKWGGYIGYSKGLRNFKSGYLGGTNEAFGNLIRFGIIYKLK